MMDSIGERIKSIIAFLDGAAREAIYCVYVHITPDERRYVGMTSKDPKARWRNGYGYENNASFFEAIMQYGWANIEHEIVFAGLTEAEARQAEKKLIDAYQTRKRAFGFNTYR
jgi:hypothetical protein